MRSESVPGGASDRWLLVGEVVTADAALRGLVRAGHPPAAIITTDIARVQERSGMHQSYYGDLPAAGRALGIPVIVIEDLSASIATVREFEPRLLWVIGWPYMVRQDVLDAVPCIGMHPTRLPRRRGGAPLNWAILDGERSSAVSLLRLRPGVDSGEVLGQRDFEIGADEYVGEVLQRVCSITEDLVAETAPRLVEGTADWSEQDERLATYTRRRRPDDGRIMWRDSAERIRNLVRAIARPFPGAFTCLDGRRLTIQRAEVPLGYRAPVKAEPGTILDCRPDGVLIATRDNALLVTDAELDDVPLTGEALQAALAPYAGGVLQ